MKVRTSLDDPAWSNFRSLDLAEEHLADVHVNS